MAAPAFAVRSIHASILGAACGLKLRMVPIASASSGMMFHGGAGVDRADGDKADPVEYFSRSRSHINNEMSIITGSMVLRIAHAPRGQQSR